MTGEDVRHVKDRLVELGYLRASTHNRFGSDTHAAVRRYQADRGLDVDGIVGPLTWAALFDDADSTAAPAAGANVPEEIVNEEALLDAVNEEIPPTDEIGDEIPAHIVNTAAAAIMAALAGVSSTRKAIVLEALRWAVDPSEPGDTMRSFYIRGGNLYNKNTLALNVMIESKLSSYFANSAHSQYYDGGRKELMQRMAEASAFTITGADCSGGVVGLWLHQGVVKVGFDATANDLYNKYCTPTGDPQPADLAWRSGHIGVYVGGGYVVEWVGGAYGCQLTRISKRRAYNYLTGRLDAKSAWSGYGDPKVY